MVPEFVLVLAPIFVLIGVFCAEVVIRKKKNEKLRNLLNKQIWRKKI